MPGNFNPAQIDYSWIGDIGDSVAGGLSQRWQNQAVDRAIGSAKNPDGSFDYSKAVVNLARIGATKEANALSAYAQSQAMMEYRGGMLGVAQEKANEESPDMQLWRAWQESQGGAAEPMRASEPQPSGTPGVSFQNAPAFITEKLAPVAEKKRLETEGAKQGERNAQTATMEQVGPGMQKIIDQLVVDAQTADDDTFKNALGPWQGAGEAETLTGAATQFFPQTLGSVANYFDKGSKEGFVDWKTGNVKTPGELSGGYTSTVRSKINATQSTLISVLQRALRVPGIGAQSDAELRQIVNQVGELNKSRDKTDFYDRLSNVVTNLRNLGIPIEMPAAEELGGIKPTSAAAQNYTQPPQLEEAGAVPYDAAEEAPPADPRGAYFAGPGQTQGMNRNVERGYATEGQIISNGDKSYIVRGGRWVPLN
jgi:hypothetical protein